jgi:Sulfatase
MLCGMKKWDVSYRFLCVLPWMAVCFSTLFLKWKLMRFGGFLFVLSAPSRTNYSPSVEMEDFTLFQQLSFFRADLFIVFFLAPLMMALIPGDRRWRVLLVSAICSVAIFYLDIEHHSLNLTGEFVSFDLVWEGIVWGLRRPYIATSFIAVKPIILFLALQAAIVTSAWWLNRLRSTDEASRVLRAMAWAYLGLACLTAVAWLPWVPKSSYHTSVVFTLWKAMSRNEEVPPTPPENLINKYQTLVHSPKTSDVPAHWGKAKDFDIILFVMETAPERCVSFDGDLAPPNIRRLAKRSWIGTKHHTTYPWSDRAVYSILSSRYPPEHVVGDAEIQKEKGGLMKALNAIGYRTALFSDLDFGLFPYVDLGIAHIVTADQQWPSEVRRSGRPEELDEWALQLMKQEIVGWIKEDRRYAVLYFPQTAHAPWIDIKDDGKERSLLERCQNLVSLEDEWLGQLIDLLESHGRLDRTLIVVTGDHGIRMRAEDPGLRPGRIDAYTFQVPFLLYAPTVVPETEKIRWVTSHIDISSSLLDLLGVDEGRGLEQGTPIWDPGLRERITYFWATATLGADGYSENGEYYMWNRLADAVFRNDELHFEDWNLVPRASVVATRVVSNILEMDAIRSASQKAAQLPSGR